MSQPASEQSDIIEHIAPAELPGAVSGAEFAEAAALAESAGATETAEATEALSTGLDAPLSVPRLKSVLESLFLVADRPLPVARIVELLEEVASPVAGQEPGPPLYQASEVQALLVAMAAEQRTEGRGMELHQVAGGWQLRTAPENAPWVQRLLQQKPTRLSRAQLEVLAIVAYRQPITRPEIDDIRGVDSGGALKTLLERRLVRILGKKEEPGRPLLYGTTREFLEFFNLRDLKDLPTLREYYDLSEEHKAQVRAAHGDDAAPLAAAAAEPAEAAPVPPPPSRVEVVDQHLMDDAEQLSKIDELIGSVSTSFPDLEAVLSPKPPASGENSSEQPEQREPKAS